MAEAIVLPVKLELDGKAADRQADQIAADIEKRFDGLGEGIGDDLAKGIEQAAPKVQKATSKVAEAVDVVRLKTANLDEQREKSIKSVQNLERYEKALAAARDDAATDTAKLEKLEAQVDAARVGAARQAKQLTQAEVAHARAIRDSAAAQSELHRAMRESGAPRGGSMQSAGEDAGSSFMDGFSGGVAALATRAGPIGAALAGVGALGLAAGKVLADNVLAGFDLKQGRAMMQASLGLSDSETAAMGRTAGQLYSQNFGENLTDVQQALAAVTGTLPTADAQDITGTALTFRDVFGTDVTESTATAQSLIINGLATDAEQAFDLMTTAYQRVPAAMRDELPDIITEYGQYFNELGISGAEAFSMLVDAAPRGSIALDKFGDALKELTLRATDLGDTGAKATLTGLGLDGQTVANNLLAGGDTAQGQTRQLVAGLLSIKDPAEQAQAALSLFGTPLEDLGKGGIPAFLTSLNQAGQSMNGFTGSADKMVATVGNTAASSWESMLRTIDTGKMAMQESMADAFGPAFTGISTWVTQNQDTVTGFFEGLAEGAAKTGAVVAYMAGGLVQNFGYAIGFIGDTIGFALDGFEQLAHGTATVMDFLGADGLAANAREAAEELGVLSDSFHGAGEDSIALGQGLIDASGSLWEFQTGMGATGTSANNAAAQIASVTEQMNLLPGGKTIDINAVVTFRDQAGRAVDPSQLLGFNPNEFATAGDAQRARRGLPPVPAGTDPRFPTPTTWTPPPAAASSSGGSGASGGSATRGYSSDQALLSQIPAGIYSQEGAADLLEGIGDCTSSIEDLVALIDGNTTAGRSMSTGNADEWLRAHGFLPGRGGPGDFRVGFNPTHMQATLPGGTPFSWGSDSAAARRGIGGLGADDPSLTSHYYRPTEESFKGVYGSGTTPVSVESFGSGAQSALQQTLGAPLDGDFGFSKGLGGVIENAVKAIANLAFAPVFGALSGVTAAYGSAGPGSGLLGMLAPPQQGYAPTPTMGVPPVSAGGYAPHGTAGGAAPGPVGLGSLATSPYSATPYAPGTIPVQAGQGVPIPLAPGQSQIQFANPGTRSTAERGISMGQGRPASPGIGLSGGGLLGMAGQAATMAAGVAGGLGGGGGGGAAAAGAQIGIDLLNRAIGFGAQTAGIGFEGLMEALLPVDSELADPTRGWFGRVLGAVAGVRPAADNLAAGLTEATDTGKPGDKPLTPEQVAKAADAKAASGGKESSVSNHTEINVTNNRPTEDGTGRDIARYASAAVGRR